MPSAVANTPLLESLTSVFPLTFPAPNPLTKPDLVSTKDIVREEDLLRNPLSFRHWWSAIQNAKEIAAAQQKAEGPSDLSPEAAAFLGPLASPAARKSLQRLTYLYEAALANFPTSYKLWKSYLQTRMSFVLGRLIVKKRAGGKKKLPEMREALQDEKEDMEQWEGGLNEIIGWDEWKALIATFERALMWLPKVCQVDKLRSCFEPNARIDAPAMVAVYVHIQPSLLPSNSLPHSCATYIRPCPAHSSAILAPSHMGPLPTLGREQGWRDDCVCIPAIPRR